MGPRSALLRLTIGIGVEVETKLIIVRGCFEMNICMTRSAQGNQIVGVFVKDAQIGAVMHFSSRACFAVFTDSFGTTKRCNPSLSPELTVEVPLISKLSIERYYFGHRLLRWREIAREQLCDPRTERRRSQIYQNSTNVKHD